MLLYKHFKDEKYLNDWLNGCFTFTKLTVFQNKEKEEDHFTDHHEVSIIAPITNEKLILHGFNGIDLFSVTDKKIYKPIPKEKAKFILISSFATETNEELRKKFGQYVLEFDFNEDLKTLFSNVGERGGILFKEVTYFEDNGKIFSNRIDSPVSQMIDFPYEELLLKNRDLFNSILFNKRKKYSYQKEFRFVLVLNKNLIKKGCKALFEALSGDEENYFPVTLQNDKIKSLKPFLKISNINC